MKKPQFNWTTPVLCVNNVSKSLDYYHQKLGFDIDWQWSENDEFDTKTAPSFACVTRGHTSLFLCERGQGSPGSWNCLNVATLEELDTLHKEYSLSGAIIAQPPEGFSWGMREMIVKDIDGNVFRMGAPINESCEE